MNSSTYCLLKNKTYAWRDVLPSKKQQREPNPFTTVSVRGDDAFNLLCSEILDYIKLNQGCTFKSIWLAHKFNDSSVRRALKKLCEDGLLENKPSGGGQNGSHSIYRALTKC